jgi:hypothetical protein
MQIRKPPGFGWGVFLSAVVVISWRQARTRPRVEHDAEKEQPAFDKMI